MEIAGLSRNEGTAPIKSGMQMYELQNRIAQHYKERSKFPVFLVNYENLPYLYFDSRYQKFLVEI